MFYLWKETSVFLRLHLFFAVADRLGRAQYCVMLIPAAFAIAVNAPGCFIAPCIHLFFVDASAIHFLLIHTYIITQVHEIKNDNPGFHFHLQSSHLYSFP